MTKPRRLTRRNLIRAVGLGGVSLAGVVALAGCGDTEIIEVIKEVPVEKIVIQTEVVEKLVTQAPVTPKDVTLRLIMLSMNEDTQLYFDELALPGFLETHPGYKVEVDLSTWDNLGEKMLTSFAGNIPVDVVQAGADWIGPYAIRGQFISLAPFTDSAVYAEELADFYPEQLDWARFKGEIYGMPWVLDLRTMWYRKDLFEQAGLDPEMPPQTWDDLVEYGLKLTNRGENDNFTGEGSVSGYNLAAPTPGGAFFEFWYRLVQNGGGIMTPWDGTDVTVNAPEGVEALQWLVDLVQKHRISPVGGSVSPIPNLSPLASGATAMHVTGGGELGNWLTYTPDKLELLGIGVPLKQAKQRQYGMPNTYSIGETTVDAEASWELMKHMISKRTLTGMLSPRSSSPPRLSIAQNAKYMQNPYSKSLQAVADNGWGMSTPQVVDYPTLAEIGEWVQGALLGELTPKEALDKAAEGLEAFVAALK